MAVLLFVMFKISTDYYIVRPGSSEALSELVNVEGGYNLASSDRSRQGEFYLTTVNQTPANLLAWIYGYLNPYVGLVEREDVIPEDMEIEDYRDMMKRHMEDSKETSKVVALENAGYEIKIDSEGILIVGVQEESPARGVLEEGDLVIEVDGKEVKLAEEMVEIVNERDIGEPVEIRYKRKGEAHTEKIETVKRRGDDGRAQAALKVFVRTKGWSPVFPMEIEIDSGDIGGPSAGLMFALEIKNQLTEYDLTGGKKIAGTGTLNLEGDVNSVGGVRHKMVAASEEGVRYFLVPGGNASVAEYVADYYDEFDAVIVDDFQDALDFLQDLP